ncbi:MAG: DUF1552 domain-containing protein [Bdellovibrionales bacterium]
MKDPKISRRDFLHYLSLAAAGGFLGSSLPIYRTFASTGQAPLRLLILPKYFGWMTRFTDTDRPFVLDSTDPHGFTFHDYLAPFNSIKQHMTIVENLRGVHWGNAHDHSFANILTNACIQNEMTSQQLQYNEPMGPSIDWEIAKRLNKDVLRADLGIGRGAPLCFDDNYIKQLMFSSNTEIFDNVVQPILNFQSGGSNTDLIAAAVNQELFRVLGQSTDRIKLLLQGTGNEERKLTSFKESLAAANPNSRKVTSTLMSIPNISRPSDDGNVLDKLTIALSLTKAAFMADTKRIGVISFPGTGPHSGISWTDTDGNPQTGMAKVNEDWVAQGNISDPTNFHHLVSHYNRNDPVTSRQVVDINAARCFAGSITPFAQVVTNFVQDLASTTDIDGNPMIDNTCIVLTSEIATGTHDTKRKPLFLIGGKNAGGFTTGRFIEGPTVNTSNVTINEQERSGNIVRSTVSGTNVGLRTHSDVFVAIANAMGASMNSFGLEVRNSSPFSL